MRLLCTECNWRGDEAEVLRAPSPFDPQEEILGCPKCKSVTTFYGACDEPDCWKVASCGTPTPDGYRRTCGDHAPTPGARRGVLRSVT